MISEKMTGLGKKSSVIREIFEYAKKRRAEIGYDKVFDFSIGNPSVPAPCKVGETIKHLVDTVDPVALHGYTSAAGDMKVRTKIAESLNRRCNAGAKPELIYMTCGAAASLTISLNALLNEGDEVIIFAPFFPEYRVFIEKAGGVPVVVKCREGDFQIDFDALKKVISPKTKAVIINSPNNPTGAVLSEETVKELSALLCEREQQYGTDIYLISDEPYRELVYGRIKLPFITQYYDNAIVCYSFSKALSLPGERIGYIMVSPKMQNHGDVFAAVCGAGRALGFVCAPSLMQYVAAECADDTSDVTVYDRNRKLLYEALTKYGYCVVKPDGAFYLFVKALEPDAYAFCERAKKYELLLVPSDDFGFTGYVRIAYCVQTEQIEAALPLFEKLYSDYNN